MTAAELPLNLTISEAEADARLMDELTGYLLEELRDLGVDSVERTAASAPDKAKGDGFTLGALALVALPALLPGLVAFLQAWTLRGRGRSLTIKTPAGLEVTFTPDKRFSQVELLDLVQQLAAGGATGSAPTTAASDQRTRLRQFLTAHFSEQELRDLAFDRNIEYDALPGQGTADKSRELVKYAERHGRFQELVAIARQLRPNVPW
jgi:hypothetical protein